MATSLAAAGSASPALACKPSGRPATSSDHRPQSRLLMDVQRPGISTWSSVFGVRAGRGIEQMRLPLSRRASADPASTFPGQGQRLAGCAGRNDLANHVGDLLSHASSSGCGKRRSRRHRCRCHRCYLRSDARRQNSHTSQAPMREQRRRPLKGYSNCLHFWHLIT